MWKFVFTALWLLAMAVLDIRERHVPIWMIVPGAAAAAVAAVVSARQGTAGSGELLRSMAPGAAMMAVVVLTGQAGWADGVVLAALGPLAGTRGCAFSFACSMFLILAVSLPLLVLKRIRKNTRLPYLPFLCAGYLVQAAAGFAG